MSEGLFCQVFRQLVLERLCFYLQEEDLVALSQTCHQMIGVLRPLMINVLATKDSGFMDRRYFKEPFLVPLYFKCLHHVHENREQYNNKLEALSGSRTWYFAEDHKRVLLSLISPASFVELWCSPIDLKTVDQTKLQTITCTLMMIRDCGWLRLEAYMDRMQLDNKARQSIYAEAIVSTLYYLQQRYSKDVILETGFRTLCRTWDEIIIESDELKEWISEILFESTFINMPEIIHYLPENAANSTILEDGVRYPANLEFMIRHEIIKTNDLLHACQWYWTYVKDIFEGGDHRGSDEFMDSLVAFIQICGPHFCFRNRGLKNELKIWHHHYKTRDPPNKKILRQLKEWMDI